MQYKSFCYCLITLFLCLSIAQDAFASHFSGGAITYKVLSKNGIYRTLEITVWLVGDDGPTSAGLPNQSMSITVTHCNTSSSLSLSKEFDGDSYIDLSNSRCFEITANSTKHRVVSYVGILYLSYSSAATCNSWVLEYSQCCMANTFSNIVGNRNFYISTEIFMEAIKDVQSGLVFKPSNMYIPTCLNKAFANNAVYDADGDSLKFTRTNYREDSSTFTPFNPGYSTSNSIQTSNAAIFDASTGSLQTIPDSTQYILLPIIGHEYRTNNFGQTVLFSKSYFLKYFKSEGNCTPLSSNFKIQPRIISGNPTYQVDLNCMATSLTLEFDLPITVNSISPNGTDFYILNSKGYLLPVLSASEQNWVFPGDYTTEIKVEFGLPVDYNDTLMIFTKRGDDGNSLISSCGTEMQPDSMRIVVKNCSGIGLQETAKLVKPFEVYPNPFKDYFVINCLTPSLIELFTLDGKKVLETNLNAGEHSLNVPNGASIYVLKVSTENQVFTSKLIREQ